MMPPEPFHVMIQMCTAKETTMTEISGMATVGALVAERPLRAKLFERHDIDFCCGGKKTIFEVCQTKELDAKWLIAELTNFDAQTAMIVSEPPLASSTLSELIDHIETTHHAYLKEHLPRLLKLMDKVAHVHGETKPFLLRMRGLIYELFEDLMPHMMKEEEVLFPLIRRLEKSDQLPMFHCGSIQNPMRVMEIEHEEVGRLLRKIRQITDEYKPPSDACNSFLALYAFLEDLERDLHIHIHKENNILHPRVRELEAALGAMAHSS